MEYAMLSAQARATCPHCQENVLSPQGTFIVNVRNEGGLTEGFDMGREIDEEMHLEANPELKREQAFLTLIQLRDFEEAERLLLGSDDGEGGRVDVNACFEGGQTTALHMAAMNDDVDALRLLLSHGADKERRNEDRLTALDLAESVGAVRAQSYLHGG